MTIPGDRARVLGSVEEGGAEAGRLGWDDGR